MIYCAKAPFLEAMVCLICASPPCGGRRLVRFLEASDTEGSKAPSLVKQREQSNTVNLCGWWGWDRTAHATPHVLRHLTYKWLYDGSHVYVLNNNFSWERSDLGAWFSEQNYSSIQ